jgi:hypothetical protein
MPLTVARQDCMELLIQPAVSTPSAVRNKLMTRDEDAQDAARGRDKDDHSLSGAALVGVVRKYRLGG